MKKILKVGSLVLVIAILAGIGFSAYAASGKPKDSNSFEGKLQQVFYNIGMVEKQPVDYKNVYAIGEDIVIYNDELQKIVDKYRISDSDFDEETSKEEAYNYLLKREAKYQAAVDKGYTVTDEEIQDYVNKQIEESRKAVDSGGGDEFSAFLQGAGMSIEEYWQTQYDVLGKELLASKYFEKVHAEFLSTTKSENPDEEWKKYLDNMLEEIIDEQNVKILK